MRRYALCPKPKSRSRAQLPRPGQTRRAGTQVASLPSTYPARSPCCCADLHAGAALPRRALGYDCSRVVTSLRAARGSPSPAQDHADASAWSASTGPWRGAGINLAAELEGAVRVGTYRPSMVVVASGAPGTSLLSAVLPRYPQPQRWQPCRSRIGAALCLCAPWSTSQPMQRRQVGDGSTSTANPELQMAQQQRSGNGGQWKKGLRIPRPSSATARARRARRGRPECSACLR